MDDVYFDVSHIREDLDLGAHVKTLRTKYTTYLTILEVVLNFLPLGFKCTGLKDEVQRILDKEEYNMEKDYYKNGPMKNDNPTRKITIAIITFVLGKLLTSWSQSKEKSEAPSTHNMPWHYPHYTPYAPYAPYPYPPPLPMSAPNPSVQTGTMNTTNAQEIPGQITRKEEKKEFGRKTRKRAHNEEGRSNPLTAFLGPIGQIVPMFAKMFGGNNNSKDGEDVSTPSTAPVSPPMSTPLPYLPYMNPYMVDPISMYAMDFNQMFDPALTSPDLDLMASKIMADPDDSVLANLGNLADSGNVAPIEDLTKPTGNNAETSQPSVSQTSVSQETPVAIPNQVEDI
jgi:hypothetical protein